MKKKSLFSSIILIGFGLYFYLEHLPFTWLQELYHWPTLFMIIGLAFLAQGYLAKDHEAILPGTILFGFGLHFHVVQKYDIWPDHIGIFLLIIALGFLLRYQKTGAGLLQGFLFLVLSTLLLFYDNIIEWLGLLELNALSTFNLWPLLFILIGLYLFIVRQK